VAALIALLELTSNPNIIFPGMLTIVVASTTLRFFFNQPSIFLSSLKAQGLDYRQEPLAQVLSRLGVESLMNTGFIRCDMKIGCETALKTLEHRPEWLILEDAKGIPRYILLPADLQIFIDRESEQNGFNPQLELDLLEVPAIRRDIVSLGINATLKEALDKMNSERLDALWIQNYSKEITGIITREQIEQLYTQKTD